MKKAVIKYVICYSKNWDLLVLIILAIIIRHQNILINVHTAKNLTLKHCNFLPLSRINDYALVVSKQLIVLSVHLFGAY